VSDQATGWDPKGPASVHRARAAIDASGKVIAYEFTSKGFSRIDVNTNGGKPEDTLAGQFRGVELKSGDGFGVPAESYEFANKRMSWETIPPLLLTGGQLSDLSSIFKPDETSIRTYFNPGLIAYMITGSVFSALYYAVIASPGAVAYAQLHDRPPGRPLTAQTEAG